MPPDELVGVDIETDEERAVVGPSARLHTARDHDVGICQPDAAQADSPLVA